MRKILTLYCVIIVVLITACFPDKKVPPSSTVSSSESSSGDFTSGTLSTDSSSGESSSSEESSSSSSTLLETFPTESSSSNGDIELIYQEIIPKKNTANLMNPQKGGADAEAEAMRQKVLNAADANLNITGQKYYVSPRGYDWNEGTSPEKAWKTGDAVMQCTF